MYLSGYNLTNADITDAIEFYALTTASRIVLFLFLLIFHALSYDVDIKLN